MTSKELDERISILSHPGMLRDGRTERVKQLIRDCIEAVIPERHECSSECEVNSNEWRIGHGAWKDGEALTIDTIESNTKELLG
jgi:hypothetical protein